MVQDGFAVSCTCPGLAADSGSFCYSPELLPGGVCVLCVWLVHSDDLEVDMLSNKNRRFGSILVAFHLLGLFCIPLHLERCK